MVCRPHNQTGALEPKFFGAHQISHYNHALMNGKKGTPLIFLLAKVTPTGRFSKPCQKSHDDAEFLEDIIIHFMYKKNPDLRNSNGTRFLKSLVVPGLINSPQGKRTKPELDLKAAIGA